MPIFSRSRRMSFITPDEMGMNALIIPAGATINTPAIDVSDYSDIRLFAYLPPAPATFDVKLAINWPGTNIWTMLISVVAGWVSSGAFSELKQTTLGANQPAWCFRFNVKNNDAVNPQTVSMFMLAMTSKSTLNP